MANPWSDTVSFYKCSYCFQFFPFPMVGRECSTCNAMSCQQDQCLSRRAANSAYTESLPCSECYFDPPVYYVVGRY